MIEVLPDLPAGVIGFRAVGTVEASDYATVLDPAIDAAIAAAVASREKVNLVYVLGDEFDRYSIGAVWQDGLLADRPRHVWGRTALVTDHETLAGIVRGFARLLPFEFRVFPLASLPDAITWAAGHPDQA